MGGEGLSTLTQDLGDPHPNPLPKGEGKEGEEEEWPCISYLSTGYGTVPWRYSSPPHWRRAAALRTGGRAAVVPERTWATSPRSSNPTVKCFSLPPPAEGLVAVVPEGM